MHHQIQRDNNTRDVSLKYNNNTYDQDGGEYVYGKPQNNNPALNTNLNMLLHNMHSSSQANNSIPVSVSPLTNYNNSMSSFPVSAHQQQDNGNGNNSPMNRIRDGTNNTAENNGSSPMNKLRDNRGLITNNWPIAVDHTMSETTYSPLSSPLAGRRDLSRRDVYIEENVSDDSMSSSDDSSPRYPDKNSTTSMVSAQLQMANNYPQNMNSIVANMNEMSVNSPQLSPVVQERPKLDLLRDILAVQRMGHTMQSPPPQQNQPKRMTKRLRLETLQAYMTPEQKEEQKKKQRGSFEEMHEKVKAKKRPPRKDFWQQVKPDN